MVNAFNRGDAIPELSNRTLPVYINRGYTEEDELTYHLPEGYTVEMKPADTEIKSLFGTYSLKVQLSPDKIIYKRKLLLNAGTFPAAKYEELFNFMSSAEISDQSKVVFKKTSSK